MTDNTSQPTRRSLRVTRNASGELVTADESGNPTNAPAPKVLAAGVTMGALVVVVAMLTAITPDLLGFAGDWAPVLFAGIVAAGGFLAGYIKRP